MKIFLIILTLGLIISLAIYLYKAKIKGKITMKSCINKKNKSNGKFYN